MLGDTRRNGMKKWLTIALALTVALVGALALGQGGGDACGSRIC
jgi:hypothetical protein